MKLIINFYLILLAFFFHSCKGFLEIDPPKDKASTDEIFTNDVIATSAITGIYSRMSTSTSAFSGSQNSVAAISGLSSDELRSYNLTLDDFYRNNVSSNNAKISTLWTDAYAFIYTSNSILEGLNLKNGVTESTSNQLRGEAKFVRAFCYFYLVNLFGEVPLNLTTDYRINEIAQKSPKDKIYSQIISDLTDAEVLLSSNYITSERIRPNKWAAKALLSRVYLYTEKWDLAAQKASEVIDQKAMYGLVDDLDQVFLKNSKETIWQLMPTAGSNTNEGALFNLISTPTNVSLSPDFASSFENGDNRKTKWTSIFKNTTGTYYYPLKYKIRTTLNGVISEYSMILRLAELHLIRAEASAKLTLPNLALEDINLIRKRAGLLVPLVGLNPTQCLEEIEKQRRFELFTEWGHRWLDLKRTGRASEVLAPLKAPLWQDADVLYPIPDIETTRNPSLR